MQVEAIEGRARHQLVEIDSWRAEEAAVVRPSVLVVEDDAATRAFLQDLLAAQGYRVRVAADGKEALAAIDAEHPDLVLSDVVMPNLDGISLVVQLRARQDNVPVILMSRSLRRSPLATVRLIRKPFDVQRLLAAVSEALDSAARNHPVPTT